MEKSTTIENSKLSMDLANESHFNSLFFISEERTKELSEVIADATIKMMMNKKNAGMSSAIQHIYDNTRHINEYSFCLMLLIIQYEQERNRVEGKMILGKLLGLGKIGE